MKPNIIFTSFMVLISLCCWAQQDTVYQRGDGQWERPNLITANMSFQTFMDGNGFIKNEHVGHGNKLNIRYGGTYKRSFNKKHAMEVSISRLSTSFYHSGKDLQSFERGDYLGRYFWLFEANYLYNLIQNRHIRIKGGIGADFRHGSESFLVSASNLNGVYPESKFAGYRLNDIGLSTGMEAEVRLFWHVHMTAKVEYTRFVFTYEKEKPRWDFDPGPTKNMLSFQLGLGYRF